MSNWYSCLPTHICSLLYIIFTLQLADGIDDAQPVVHSCAVKSHLVAYVSFLYSKVIFTIEVMH